MQGNKIVCLLDTHVKRGIGDGGAIPDPKIDSGPLVLRSPPRLAGSLRHGPGRSAPSVPDLARRLKKPVSALNRLLPSLVRPHPSLAEAPPGFSYLPPRLPASWQTCNEASQGFAKPGKLEQRARRDDLDHRKLARRDPALIRRSTRSPHRVARWVAQRRGLNRSSQERRGASQGPDAPAQDSTSTGCPCRTLLRGSPSLSSAPRVFSWPHEVS